LAVFDFGFGHSSSARLLEHLPSPVPIAMPLHTAASALQYIDTTVLALTVAGLAGMGLIKTKLSGRTCTWERDWAGKMIIVSVSTLQSIQLILGSTDTNRSQPDRLPAQPPPASADPLPRTVPFAPA